MSNEAVQGAQYGLKDFVEALARRRGVAIVLAVVCVSVALAFALLLPPE